MNSEKDLNPRALPSGDEVLAIAREYFPDWCDDDLGFILWNETAYPCNLVHDDRQEPLRAQLAALAKTLKENPAYVLGSCEDNSATDSNAPSVDGLAGDVNAG